MLLEPRGDESIGVAEAGGERGDKDAERFIVELMCIKDLTSLFDDGIVFIGFGGASCVAE